MVLLGLLIYGGILVQAVRRMVVAPPVGPELPNLAIAQWVLVGSAVLGLGLAIRALLVFGPVVAGGPFQFWLLSTPLSRRSLLGVRFWWMAIVATVSGGLFGLAGSALVRAELSGKVLSVVLGAAMTATVLAVCVLLQEKAKAGRGLSTGLVGSGVVIAAAGAFAQPPVIDPPIVLVAIAVVPVVAVIQAYRATNGLDRAALASGAEILSATQTAATWLDISMFTGIAATRKWRRIGRVTSKPLRGTHYQAMFVADVRRLTRARAALYVWAGLLLVPYAVARLLPEPFVPLVQLVICAIAVSPFASGLRNVCRSMAIRRSLGGSNAGLHVTHLIVPTVMALVWTALTGAATGFALATGIVPIGAVGFVYRRATQPSMDYSGTAVDTPFGLMQPDMFRQLVRGPLLLVILAAVQLNL
jgi:hypothetical protein